MHKGVYFTKKKKNDYQVYLCIYKIDGQKSIVQINLKQLLVPQDQQLYMLPVRMDAQKLSIYYLEMEPRSMSRINMGLAQLM